MVAGAAPALLALGIQMIVPESQRWKQSVKQGAAKPVREIFPSSLLVTTLLAISFASVALIGTWGSVQWLPLWADQLTGGKMPHAKAATQIVSGVGAIFGCFIGAWFGGRMGRHPTYFGLCLLSLLVCGYLFRTVDQYGTEFLVTVGLIGAVTAAFYG